MPKYYEKGDKVSSRKYKKIFGALLILSGAAVFVYFLFPILSYEFFLSDYLKSSIEVPIPKYMVINNPADFGSLISQGISSLTTNYNDARNWYPALSSSTSRAAPVDSYFLSIPKLGIAKAEVSTRDYDLDRHLIQYLGTSNPGENGTAVIFGHSTLPSWFDPKNYKTIFATLHKIKVGDEIDTTVNNITYKYKIFAITVTDSSDTNILSQSYDHPYITLVTCTPPGTIWKRLVVRAALETVDST